jgi:hypothetical protein
VRQRFPLPYIVQDAWYLFTSRRVIAVALTVNRAI